MSWQLALPVASTVVVAVITVVGAIWVKSQNRGVDEATARKTNAEAGKLELERFQSVMVELRAIMEDRDKIANAKIELAETRASAQIESVRAASEADAKAIRERLVATEEQIRALREAWAAHSPWDTATWAMVREAHPEYPGPPPINLPPEP